MGKDLYAILITGIPGVGKTTVVKQLSNDLRQLSLKVKGFYTEEVRHPTTKLRIGFDIISLDGDRGILARTTSESSRPHQGDLARHGKYSVMIDEFEKIALPILDSKSDILIIDEIGKMELFSKKFEQKLKEVIENVSIGQIRLVATIPLKQNLRVVDQIKHLRNSKLFEINTQNRNHIYSNIREDVLILAEK